MTSFGDLDLLIGSVPARVVGDLRTIDLTAGSEPLLRAALPGLFASLADRARTAGVLASAQVDGVAAADRARSTAIAEGRADDLRDRDEHELTGYRAAALHLESERRALLDPAVVLDVHRLFLRGTATPGGRLRHVEQPVGGPSTPGARTKRFVPVPVAAIPDHLDELAVRYADARDVDRHHPVLLVGLAALDLLAIHPFTVGNGRVVRALTTALLDDAGYRVARYVPLDPVIARSGAAYATALLDATHNWQDGRHDPWPWLRYLTAALADCSTQLTTLTTRARSSGSKQERVRDHVLHHAGRTFQLRDLRAALPGVSDPTFRLVLTQLKAEGLVDNDGTGRSARWTTHPR